MTKVPEQAVYLGVAPQKCQWERGDFGRVGTAAELVATEGSWDSSCREAQGWGGGSFIHRVRAVSGGH